MKRVGTLKSFLLTFGVIAFLGILVVVYYVSGIAADIQLDRSVRNPSLVAGKTIHRSSYVAPGDDAELVFRTVDSAKIDELISTKWVLKSCDDKESQKCAMGEWLKIKDIPKGIYIDNTQFLNESNLKLYKQFRNDTHTLCTYHWDYYGGDLYDNVTTLCVNKSLGLLVYSYLNI